MLFISDNKKIDAVIKKLQPSLKLKINIERDFDCGLNDVFEKRPDVVFIQNQIAGVTGENVARHIQLLLGEAAPKFIFIHDGDAKAKPKKGLYEYLVDLSQNEENVAADILNKLNLLLGLKWQAIFVTSLFQGVDYEAFTPDPEPPRDPVSSFSFDVAPEVKPAVPDTAPLEYPLLSAQEIAVDEACDVVPGAFSQYPEIFYEESKEPESKETATIPSGDSAPLEILFSSEPAVPVADSDLPAVLPGNSASMVAGSTPVPVMTELSRQAVEKSTDGASFSTSSLEDSRLLLDSAPVGRNSFDTAAATLPYAEKPRVRYISETDHAVVAKEDPLVAVQEELQWVFEGEPSLKKSAWKRYQFIEFLLVFFLLLGGGYLIKQKMHPPQPDAEEVKLLSSAATSPPVQDAAPAGKPSLPVELPSFIPIAGLDPAFAEKNPGWERYVGAGSEFRLFRENGKLKAVQVKADKGKIVSEPLLNSILVELAGSAAYHVNSQENKLGFQVLNATINGKAELLIYRNKSAVHAFVVSLN